MQDPWEDKRLMNEYCYEHADDFDYFIAENYPSDYRTSNYEQLEESYCEKNWCKFLDFAANYYDDQILENADNMNNLREEK